MSSRKSWFLNIIVGIKRSLPDKKADKEFGWASWCTVRTRANVFSILFSEWSAPFVNEVSACSLSLLMDHISASNTNSMCLAGCLNFPYVFFTGTFSELFSAQSLETAINWQHKPEAEVLKWIHYFLLGNCSHGEQRRRPRNHKITLSGWEKGELRHRFPC